MIHCKGIGVVCAFLVAWAIAPGSARAVELANIDADGPGTASAPVLSIPAGQSTANFFVEEATGPGLYPIRVGESRTDDYYGGVLITSAREFGGRTDGLGTAFWPVTGVTANPAGGAPAPDGTVNIYVRQRVGATTNVPSNSNVAAGYFPYAEGWVGGMLRNTANGGNANDTSSLNGVDLVTIQANFNSIENGVSRVVIPNLTDTRQQGLLFVNHAKNEDNYASVAPSPNGDAFVVTVSNGGNGMTPESDPYAFVYIPHGTAGVTMASIHGASGADQHATVLSQTGNFTVVREGVGTYRLSIPGQSPTTGVLLTNSGGQITSAASSVSDNLVTYQADGDDWIIQTREWGTGTPDLVEPFLEIPLGDRSQSFQFAFMPFSAPPTGPGANPTPLNFKDKVLGFNVEITEVNGTLNDIPGMYGTVASGTTGHNFEHLRQNKGDNSIAINGVFPAASDGIFFATVNQGFRDNSATGGDAAWGMIAAGDNAGGWEFATHVADPGLGVASSVELNVNFSAVMFGADTPFQKAHMALQPVDPAPPGLTLSLPGVNTLNDGVLVAQGWGNNDDFAVVTPAADGSNWSINTYDNNTGQSRNEINWIYLPYAAENLVAGRVDGAGTVQSSTDPVEFTLAKQGTGQYLLTIVGKTPDDGTLLLTPEQTGGVEDNVLVYEAMGSSFLISGVDQVSFEEKQSFILPMLEDTSFTFAFIDHDAPPTLDTSFLAGDFNEDTLVNAADLESWKDGFDTATGASHTDGDADGDGDVDGHDFLTWQQQLGMTPAGSRWPLSAAWRRCVVAATVSRNRRRAPSERRSRGE